GSLLRCGRARYGPGGGGSVNACESDAAPETPLIVICAPADATGYVTQVCATPGSLKTVMPVPCDELSKLLTSQGASAFVPAGLLMIAPCVPPERPNNTCGLAGTEFPMLSVTVAEITVVSVPLPLIPEPLVSSASVRFDGMPT